MAMSRRTRFFLQLLAVAVIITGAVVLVPRLLVGVEWIVHELRRSWWLILLLALALWWLVAGRKR